ncbi:amidohydrolase family protein [Congregibacter variabilis]|uniref:Amidohydrolase family protein n=1 Tax=Congregibacter variabilis TaxID=3081200 RepID=A0ABZ0I2M8_9GAMM|nr:amidohydrolase family protein [Congregibacter sp. IMCC43200]
MHHLKHTNSDRPARTPGCLAALGVAIVLSFTGVAQAQVIYTAAKVITMDPGQPVATAVAVNDGRIVAVGDLAQLQSTPALGDYAIDRRFDKKVLSPGFIDPHVHPTLPAVLTQLPFLAPDDWDLPTGSFPGALTPEDFESRLRALVAAHEGPLPFIVWGYHPLWHGDVYREQLSEWFPNQSVMLWHRSFHELILNDAAIAELALSEAQVRQLHESDWERGHFWENGLKALVPKLGFLFEPTRFLQGMENFLAMAHRGGVTTALDMGTGIFGNPEQELALIRKAVADTNAPIRIIMTPIITDFLARGRSPAQAEQEIDRWRDSNSERVMVDRHFKLMMDGAIYSGLAQMGPPGYLDGHKGQWMAPLEVTQAWGAHFWKAGYKIHAHTNGDASAAALIDMLRELQIEHPRADHRLTLEHFAYTTEEQVRQLKDLGAVISANPYYHYILSDLYGDAWLGPDRSAQMVRLGSAERLGVPLALHSDAPMAPMEPLTLAWTATNRITINGNATGQEQRISLDAALRGITIDAAWVMGWEDEIGSIRAGKRADFTVLEQDPYEVGIIGLRNVSIWGTVFEGRPVKIP